MFNSIKNVFKYRGIYKIESILWLLVRKNESKVTYVDIDEEFKLMKTSMYLDIGKKHFIENEVRFHDGRFTIVKSMALFGKVRVKLWVYGLFHDNTFPMGELVRGPSLEHTKEEVLDKQMLEVMRIQKFTEILVIRDGNYIRMYEKIKSQRGL